MPKPRMGFSHPPIERPAVSEETLTIMREVEHLISRALSLLDKADAPSDIGAHLDLALCRMKGIAVTTPLTAAS